MHFHQSDRQTIFRPKLKGNKVGDDWGRGAQNDDRIDSGRERNPSEQFKINNRNRFNTYSNQIRKQKQTFKRQTHNQAEQGNISLLIWTSQAGWLPSAEETSQLRWKTPGDEETEEPVAWMLGSSDYEKGNELIHNFWKSFRTKLSLIIAWFIALNKTWTKSPKSAEDGSCRSYTLNMES